ncbi:MAG: 16S rRNA (cytosine(1402)-N(4))-methyltransferase RsmH [bacterium]
MSESAHIPVLLKESIEYLLTNKNGNYFDGTIGFGGHSAELIKFLESPACLVGVDKDINAVNFCKEKFKTDPRVKIYNTSFVEIKKISKIEFIDKFDGIFADLGVSSFQLDTPDSGFSYSADAPLDFRMNKAVGISAAELINSLDENEITDILFKYGEENKSRLIARKIIETRKSGRISTTGQLKKVIEDVTPTHLRIKTLSRVFQGFRIYINSELDELKIFLDNAIELLKPGSRIVIISYHSLEDRIVKEKFKYESLECICPPGLPICVCNKKPGLKIFTKKPVVPSDEETKINKRARSAKLRVAEKI